MKKNRLVVADAAWAETIPDWLRKEVEFERLASNLMGLRGKKIEEVGDAEACVHLYTANLRVKLDYNMAQIYLYLCSKLLEKRGSDMPDDVAVHHLTEDQQRKLDELKRELYRKRGGRIRDPFIVVMREVFKKEEVFE